jgi:hypothetical protein
MANDALFIGWGAVVRGREQKALQVFQETVGFWGQAQQDGRIEGFDVYLLQPHGGGLAGFFLVRGERSRLADLRGSEDFERIITRAGTIVEELGVVSAYGEEALARQMQQFQQAAEELG